MSQNKLKEKGLLFIFLLYFFFLMIPSTFLGKTVEEHEEKTKGHSMDRIPQKQSHSAQPPWMGAGRT